MDKDILGKFVEDLCPEWEKCINSIDFVIKSMYKDYKKEYKL